MKILHVDTGKEFRGGQRQAEILHRGLLKNGIESYFLVNKYGKLLDRSDNTIAFDYSSEFSIKTHKDFLKVLEEIKPDIVHTHDGHAVLFASLYKNKFNYKVIETRRVSYPISYVSRYLKYKNVDKHVAVSQDTANYLQNYFSNISVIHSCIELKRFDQETKEVLKEKNKINLVYVGAFSAQKGIDVLINAFINLNRNDVSLHLIGDGQLLDSMKKISNKNCIFYGRRDDVEDFYKNADCIVVPSVNGEGSSGVIKEGMVANKLVIASDLEANTELINDNVDGIFFKNSDIKSLEEKLRMFLNGEINIDYEKIAEASKLFDCKFLVKKYIEIYYELEK